MTTDSITDVPGVASHALLSVAPYYERGGITIYHGDATEILPTLRGVDMVFTSPPYNLGTHPSGKGSGMHAGSGYTANGKTWHGVADLAGGYENYGDGMPQDKYDAWQTEIVRMCWETLSDVGAIFYNHKPRPMNGALKLPLDYGDGLPLRQIITWARGVGMNFAHTHFVPKTEWICVWAKAGWRLTDKKASGAGDLWEVFPETDRAHPAPFPLELPSKAIGATSAQVILDPFMGSGTTMLAAKNHNRRGIGIEISEKYCEIAARRLSQDVLPLFSHNS
jgi:modification methylase